MAKQSGLCGFSKACIHPGPWLRLGRTDRYFCPPHLRLVEIAPAAGSAASDQASRISTAGLTGNTAVQVSAAAFRGLVKG